MIRILFDIFLLLLLCIESKDSNLSFETQNLDEELIIFRERKANNVQRVRNSFSFIDTFAFRYFYFY